MCYVCGVAFFYLAWLCVLILLHYQVFRYSIFYILVHLALTLPSLPSSCVIFNDWPTLQECHDNYQHQNFEMEWKLDVWVQERGSVALGTSTSVIYWFPEVILLSGKTLFSLLFLSLFFFSSLSNLSLGYTVNWMGRFNFVCFTVNRNFYVIKKELETWKWNDFVEKV